MDADSRRSFDSNRLFPFSLLFLVLLFLPSCSDDQPAQPEVHNDPDTSPGVIHDNVVAVDDEPMELVGVEGDSYRFSLDGGAPSLGLGDVMVGRPLDGIAPDGFLRKVVDVVQVGGQVTEIVTEPASLLDAIQECVIDKSFTLPIGTGLKQDAGPNGDFGYDYLAKGVTATGYGFTFQDFVLVDYNNSGFSLFASLKSGRVQVSDPGLDLGLIIENSAMEEISWSSSCNIEMTCDLQLNVSAEFDAEEEKRLFKKRSVQVYTVAIFFPVVQVTTIEGYLGIKLDFEAAADVLMTDLGAIAHIESGARNDGQGWDTIVDVIPDTTPRDTHWNAQASLNVRPYYRHKITVKFYGIGGPIVWAKPYLNLLGEVDLGLGQWCAYVDVGCELGVGATLSILGGLDWEPPALIGTETRVFQYCEALKGKPDGLSVEPRPLRFPKGDSIFLGP